MCVSLVALSSVVVDLGSNELTGQGDCIPFNNEARVLLHYAFTSVCVLFKCILLLLLRSNNYFSFDCTPFFIWHGACKCQHRSKWARVNASHIYCLICGCVAFV